MKRNLFVAELSSALLILLYGYTASSKAIQAGRFRQALAESPVTHTGATIAAWLIILAEAATVLLLLFPRTRRKGLYASLGLLTVFTGYIWYMITFVNHLPCNCGGVISEMTWTQHLIFNSVFLVINGTGIWYWGKVYPKRKSGVHFYESV